MHEGTEIQRGFRLVINTGKYLSIIVHMPTLVNVRMSGHTFTPTCMRLDSRLLIKCKCLTFYRNAHACSHICLHEGTEVLLSDVCNLTLVYLYNNNCLTFHRNAHACSRKCLHWGDRNSTTTGGLSDIS